MQMPTRVLFVVANLLFCYLKSFLLFWEDTGGIQHSLPIRDNFLRKKWESWPHAAKYTWAAVFLPLEVAYLLTSGTALGRRVWSTPTNRHHWRLQLQQYQWLERRGPDDDCQTEHHQQQQKHVVLIVSARQQQQLNLAGVSDVWWGCGKWSSTSDEPPNAAALPYRQHVPLPPAAVSTLRLFRSAFTHPISHCCCCCCGWRQVITPCVDVIVRLHCFVSAERYSVTPCN